MKKIYLLLLAFILLINLYCSQSRDSKYLDVAIEASRWIESTKLSDDHGDYWPAQPDTTISGNIDLYHGSPGVILFYIDLYQTTGNVLAKNEAVAGAEWLLKRANKYNKGGIFWSNVTFDNEPYPDPGLYTGTSGVGAIMLSMYDLIGDKKYLDAAIDAGEFLVSSAEEVDGGIRWTQSNDIISGSSGTGMFLLRLYKVTDNNKYLKTASKAGIFLINNAIKDEKGWQWKAYESSILIYPNFSHGTSGVAFYLALLYEYTNDPKFLDAALQGASWLMNDLDPNLDGVAWKHDDGSGKDLYYVSYCHGPSGTARLFYQLYNMTGEKKWMTLVTDSAKWLINIGLDENELDGYWNVGQCCGTAGIGDFFADVYKITNQRIYYDWAIKMADHLINESSREQSAMTKWIQAENRRDPDTKFVQTGWTQGASGIGHFLLKMNALVNNNINYRPTMIPDNPFHWK